MSKQNDGQTLLLNRLKEGHSVWQDAVGAQHKLLPQPLGLSVGADSDLSRNLLGLSQTTIAKLPVQHSKRLASLEIKRFVRDIRQSDIVQQVTTPSRQPANQDNE